MEHDVASTHGNPMRPAPLNLTRIVQKRDIIFSDEENKSIDKFIIKSNECRNLSSLNDKEMLATSTQLIKGVAPQSIRQKRQD